MWTFLDLHLRESGSHGNVEPKFNQIRRGDQSWNIIHLILSLEWLDILRSLDRPNFDVYFKFYFFLGAWESAKRKPTDTSNNRSSCPRTGCISEPLPFQMVLVMYITVSKPRRPMLDLFPLSSMQHLYTVPVPCLSINTRSSSIFWTHHVGYIIYISFLT